MRKPLKEFDARCDTLMIYLDVRNCVLRIRKFYEGMSSTDPAYGSWLNMIEEKRRLLDIMQRENPWLDEALKVLHRHP